jgi:predicted enzyme related to lactoylglutathione lyase
MYALRQRPLTQRGPLLLLLLHCTSTALAAASFDLPPITTPASGEHHDGQVIWHDLETTDLARAEAFYKQLFGWQMRTYRAAGNAYVVAINAGQPVAGMLQRVVREGEERPSGWLPFVSVADVDAVVSLARRHAALVLADPQNRAERGRQALIRDPNGLALALENSSSGDPAEGQAPPGDWAANSLFARDPAAAAVFFQQILGYRVLGAAASAGFERIVLGSGARPRISVDPLPDASWPQAGAWVGFLRVPDAAEAVARALALGGRVLVEAHRDSEGAQSAILADPTGASFGVMQPPPGP